MKLFTQTVNEASTLGWGTRVKGFIACFVVGAACTILVSRHVCIHFYNDQRGRAQGGLMWPYWFFLPWGMLHSDVNSSGNFHQVALKCHLQSGEEVLNKSHLIARVSVCLAGRVRALPPQNRPHALHCVLYFWKHMCPVQVSVYHNRKSTSSLVFLDNWTLLCTLTL